MFHLTHCARQLKECCYGLQAQTAECLVVGEIATRHLCVVLNKVDLLPADMRPKLIAKARKRLAQTLAATTFAGCPMVAVSAKPGGALLPGKPSQSANHSSTDLKGMGLSMQERLKMPRCNPCLGLAETVHIAYGSARNQFISYHTGGGDGPGQAAVGVDALIEQLAKMVPPCPRQQKGSFLFAVDHCFALRGQGTVLTGTVLSGAVQVRL